MAQAEVIRGTGSELLPHLEKHLHRKGLLLIIPNEETSAPDAGTPEVGAGERPFRQDPRLMGVRFNEDPVAPLDPEDWPEAFQQRW